MFSLKQITEDAYEFWEGPVRQINRQGVPFIYNLQISPGEYPEEFDREAKVYLGNIVIREAVFNSLKSLLGIREIPQISRLKADKIQQKLPRIDIELKRRETDYHIAIEDNGPGIDPKNFGKIWAQGFSTFGTTGIGLAAMRDAVDRYCGSIDVESAPFVKTAFNIYIPCTC